jgi:Beta-propeller repeat/Putative binding domain, N-terminal
MGVFRVPHVVFLLLVCGAVLCTRPFEAGRSSHPHAPAPTPSLPLMFEPDSEADAFFARSQGYFVRLDGDGARFTTRRGGADAPITLRFAGGAGLVRAERPMNTTVNYFRGPGTAWRTGIRPFGAVRIAHVYEGIDAVFYGTGARIEYDVVVAPGASVDRIRLRFDGADRVALDGADLRVAAGRHTMTQHAPFAYQDVKGRRTAVPARYTLASDGTAGFAVAAYDLSAPLVIDPTISYSSYFGATGGDTVFGMTTDAAGNVFLVGGTDGADLPGSTSAVHGQFGDAYVAKLRPDGAPEWVSLLGGTDQPDGAMAAAIGPGGDVYVTGYSWSVDFPVTAGAYRGTTDHSCDTFVARIGGDGALKFSTMLGGPQSWGDGCGGRGIVVDPQGRAVVSGATASPSFTPTMADSTGPRQPNLDQPDAVVARFSADGARLEWSRLLAGSGFDYAAGIARDQYGNFYVTGRTTSDDFPVRNAFNAHKSEPADPDGEAGYDGFVAALFEDGTLAFSSYLGGYGDDYMNAVVVGEFDRVYVGGTTTSPFGSSNPPAPGAPSRGIVYEIIPNTTGIIGATMPAGSGFSAVTSLAVGSDWAIWAAGYTDGAGWPIVAPDDPAPQRAPGGGVDMFVQKLGAQLNSLNYSFLLGGSADDRAFAIALDRLGDIYLAGGSSSADYPVQNAVQTSRRDTSTTSTDGVITKLGCAMNVGLPIAAQPAEGGSGSFNLFAAAGCAVEPISDSPWLHVGTISGGSVSFTTDPNPTSSERRGLITVSGKEAAPITQKAGSGSAPTSTDEIVLNARDVSNKFGDWQLVPDDVHGTILTQVDAGAPKVLTPQTFPSNWFSFTFTAEAGKPYHLWIHGRAQNDWWQNDSIYAQFSDSVDAAGAPIYRMQTTSATWVSLEECSGCGEQGWGWQDNAYGTRGDLGPDIYFASSGTHTILLQTREDGFSIGQVVLSAKAFLRTAPGGALNDPTIVTFTATPPAPAPTVSHDEIVLWTAPDSAAVNGTWRRVSDTTAAGQASMWNPDAGAPKLTSPFAAPANYVDVTFDADAGKAYHLWLRMKADNDSWTNDSVWLQFSGSVDASGTAVNRIGTASGTWVSLEECSGCGEQGWGWQDNAYGTPGDLGAPVYFAASGRQTIRIQVREDGLSVDQIVLSASRYAAAAPGRAKNDATILPRTPR